MKIYKEHGLIFFYDQVEDVLGYTNYNNIIWNKIKSVNWYVIWKKTNLNGVKKGYIGTHSTKLGNRNKLHQIVMIHWYGNRVLDDAYSKKYVIDHLDNNSFDCTIENLSFAPNNVNRSKGLTYDIEREDALSSIAVNIFKDFMTKKYQITVAFNKLSFIGNNENSRPINGLRLVYDNDYKRVLFDAESLLYDYTERCIIDIRKLNYVKVEYLFPKFIELDDTTVKTNLITDEENVYLILGEHSRIDKISPNENLY